ncbi:MAG TPA: response regulator transcription factor [Chitinophagaceae bacterium]|jgi:two-component system invasion response regulator UvrY|nr:response regulator transcription factor [Chitinophagaceae bacterium]
MIRILIADDHAIVRRGMKQLLLEQYPFAEIGEASNVEDLISLIVNQKKWDVVVCDMNMPGRSGLDAIMQIKEIAPGLPVLIMSMYPEDQYALRVLKSGAAGYLAKETIHDDIVKAIETVIKGKRYITLSLAEKLAESVNNETKKALHEVLSDREFDVFKLLASGKTITEIASQLSLSSTTVSTYRSRIMEKMKMKSNAELARYAIESRLI